VYIKPSNNNFTGNHASEEFSIAKGKIEKVKKSSPFLKILKTWTVTLVTIVVIIALGITGFFYAKNLLSNSNGQSNNDNSNLNSNSDTYIPKPVYLESPVNGTYESEAKIAQLQKNKVLSVIIENLAGADGARPQAGLQQADIVYETLAEGDITRFMAVFWNNSVDDIDPTKPAATVKLQPVRSARKYFIDWLQEYNDPLFMHIGQAESDIDSTNALGALYKYGIKDLTGATNSFNREKACEAKKAQEHCAYSDTQRLWNLGSQRGWLNAGTLQKLLYKDDQAVDANATIPVAANKITVNFLGDAANYSANWAYDAATNTYLRSIGTIPHLDQVTGQQILTKTLVIQKTSITVSEDHGKYHKIIKTVGTGDAWIVQDGKYTLATWKKDNLTARTRYLDKTTGKELSLDRGKMWIMVTGQAPIFK